MKTIPKVTHPVSSRSRTNNQVTEAVQGPPTPLNHNNSMPLAPCYNAVFRYPERCSYSVNENDAPDVGMTRWGPKVPSLRILLSDVGPFSQVTWLISKRSVLLPTHTQKNPSVTFQSFTSIFLTCGLEKLTDLSSIVSYEGLLIENTGHCYESRKS